MKIKVSNEKIILTIILSIFAIIFCLISLVNHYQFRPYALDLGMFNHAIYHISQFSQPIFTLDLDGKERHYLATHFSLITYLYYPLVYLFGTYTLLILQIICILSAGLAAYLYAKLKIKSDSIIPILILIHFFCIWGIYSALSFDFHNNVIGVCLLCILFTDKKYMYKGFIGIKIGEENGVLIYKLNYSI